MAISSVGASGSASTAPLDDVGESIPAVPATEITPAPVSVDVAQTGFDAAAKSVTVGDAVYEINGDSVSLNGQVVGTCGRDGAYEVTLDGQVFSGNVGDLIGAKIEGFDSRAFTDSTESDSEGRSQRDAKGHVAGTNDDSIGRNSKNPGSPGTPGTNDDSIGRNSKNPGSPGTPGTNDDSIGTGALNGAASYRDVSALRADTSVGAARELDFVLSRLPEETLTQAQALISDPTTSVNATYALTSETFSALAADQQVKFVNVMAKSGEEGTRLMALACEKAGDLSTTRAEDGTTTLDNLDRFANTPGLGPYVDDVMADILIPDRIWQGTAPTCTSSTMQYELAKGNPAEYARLITGLAVDGSVLMAGGGTLAVAPGAAWAGSVNAGDGRSPTEAVFQAALMDFANGSATYDLTTMTSTAEDGKTYRGLYGDQIRTALTNLFDADYQTTIITSNEEAAEALQDLNLYVSRDRPILMDLVVDENSNHCVAFEGYANGLVHLRDPQTGEQSTITQQEFIETAASVHVNRSPRASAPPPSGIGQMFQ